MYPVSYYRNTIYNFILVPRLSSSIVSTGDKLYALTYCYNKENEGLAKENNI